MLKYCPICEDEKLIYGGDHDISDEDSDYSIISNFSCPKCECFIEVSQI